MTLQKAMEWLYEYGGHVRFTSGLVEDIDQRVPRPAVRVSVYGPEGGKCVAVVTHDPEAIADGMPPWEPLVKAVEELASELPSEKNPEGEAADLS